MKTSQVSVLHSFFQNDSPNRIKLAQELAASGIEKVPSTYVLPVADRPCCTQVSRTVSVPVVDFAGLSGNGKERVLKDISRACREWGFLQVINHGVPPAVIEKMWSTAERFFALQAEERARFYLKDPRNETSAGVPNATLAWRETLRFRGVWDTSDDAPNFCRQPVEDYLKELKALAAKLLKAIMETLGVAKRDVDTDNVSKTGLSMHLYPACPEPSLTLGMRGHADISTLTIVLETAGVGGLQLLKDGRWEEYNPVPGSLAVMLGEQMEILSNGIYKKVQHRVVTNRRKARMSIVSFFLPPAHAKIRPLPHLRSAGPPLYQEKAIADHLPQASIWFN